MKKASLVINEKIFLENRIFNIEDKAVNRDDCLYPFFLLKEKFYEKGYDLSTSDINAISESEIVIYNEMPKELPSTEDYEKSYLIIFESEVIRKDNWDQKRHKFFKKIFTWNDELIDNIKYFKINFSFKEPKKIPNNSFNSKSLCTLISANKKINHPQELYSKRVDIIRWFELNNSENFDLYGVGWDKYRFSGPKLIRGLNKVKFLTQLFSKKYPSYKGSVINKKETLENYKFAICFENAENISGYITEKIFDCFLAGIVPIYLGANNIDKHIPKGCYISMLDFKSYEELNLYIMNMKELDYQKILNEISKFIFSKKSYQFNSEFFSEEIVKEVMNER